MRILIGLIIASIVGGCAPTTFQGLCALKQVGQNEHGHTVVAAYCEAR